MDGNEMQAEMEAELEAMREAEWHAEMAMREQAGHDPQSFDEPDGDLDALHNLTQQSGINALFQSKPALGAPSALFFEDDGDDDDVGHLPQTPVPAGSVRHAAAQNGRHRVEHRTRHEFQSSPPTDWNIMNARARSIDRLLLEEPDDLDEVTTDEPNPFAGNIGAGSDGALDGGAPASTDDDLVFASQNTGFTGFSLGTDSRSNSFRDLDRELGLDGQVREPVHLQMENNLHGDVDGRLSPLTVSSSMRQPIPRRQLPTRLPLQPLLTRPDPSAGQQDALFSDELSELGFHDDDTDDAMAGQANPAARRPGLSGMLSGLRSSRPTNTLTAPDFGTHGASASTGATFATSSSHSASQIAGSKRNRLGIGFSSDEDDDQGGQHRGVDVGTDSSHRSGTPGFSSVAVPTALTVPSALNTPSASRAAAATSAPVSAARGAPPLQFAVSTALLVNATMQSLQSQALPGPPAAAPAASPAAASANEPAESEWHQQRQRALDRLAVRPTRRRPIRVDPDISDDENGIGNTERPSHAAPLPSFVQPPAAQSAIAASAPQTRNYRHLPLAGTPYVQARTSSGELLYFPKESRNPASCDAGQATNSTSRLRTGQSLLAVPMHRLMHEVEAARIQRESDRIQDRINAASELARTRHAGNLAGGWCCAGAGSKPKKLWVDKYSPRMYVDLVGDERLNREVLTWVKQWDFCVFGKPVKRKFADLTQSKFRRKGLFDSNAKGHGGSNRPPDPLQRPDRRILLLCGPPGLGKTTLAHVIARHAGYNVVEINASDDRTGEALKNKLTNAIECQAVMGSKLPNLVIIDEIDGASASGSGDQTFIKMLVKLVESTGHTTEASDTASANGTKKKKTRNVQLLRPIICICNDQYAQVLRPLRSVAQVYTFRPPPFQTLAKRLHEICEWEGLRADLRAMMALCEMTQGDMRSSINTLQFLHGKTRHLTKELLLGMDIGNKDFSRNFFAVWKAMFTIPNAKAAKRVDYSWRNADGGTVLGQKADENDKYVNRLVSMLQTTGDYERVMQGCFENYLSTQKFDTLGSSSGSRFDQVADYILQFDTLESRINERQEFELMAYQPYTLVHFYRLFGSGRQMDIPFPRADYQAFAAKKETEGVLSAFGDDMMMPARTLWSRGSLARLEMTFLLMTLSPDFRPVTGDLDRLVAIMTSLGLRIVQRKETGGHHHYELDPPIHSLQLVTGQHLLTINDASNVVKQLIAHEAVAAPPAPKLDLKHAEQPAPKASMPIIDKPVRDFFGRIVQVKEQPKTTRVPTVRIAFKFNEGFSNAVRTPVLVRDLL
ncbi:hypothetical protein BC831DRAFT_449485 [Entophlyctis helioformis]|nr:hypothetical protein BC831DRAFT_449485 [Entophlyctis helioformis]